MLKLEDEICCYHGIAIDEHLPKSRRVSSSSSAVEVLGAGFDSVVSCVAEGLGGFTTAEVGAGVGAAEED